MSIHDGPGIRTVVFMKGCNMRCQWCHNPETWSVHKQLEYLSEKCIHCLTCAHTCPQQLISPTLVIDRDACTKCGLCSEACPTGALSMVGRDVTPDSLWAEIQKDLPYFGESHGGVTVSGGEPLMQAGFVREFLGICRAHSVSTAIESNISMGWSTIEPLLPLVDSWYCDLKLADETKHREWTGIGNSTIIDNISHLVDSGASLCVRTPVIPGVNDSEGDIEAICEILAPYRESLHYSLLPFHTLGFGKYDSLGMHNALKDSEPLPQDTLERLRQIPAQYGLDS